MNFQDLTNKKLFIAAATKLAGVKLKEMGPAGKAVSALALGSGLYYGGGKLLEHALEKKKKPEKAKNAKDKIHEKISSLLPKLAGAKMDAFKSVIRAAGTKIPRGHMTDLLSHAQRTFAPGSKDAILATRAKWRHIGNIQSNNKLHAIINNVLSQHQGRI